LSTQESVIGFVFQVGIWEELCKSIPVFIAPFWKRWNFTPMNLVTVGVFSGLGFAAFENLNYGNIAVFQSYSLTQDFGVSGLVEGVQSAMVLVMLRAVSLVFAHAVFSGIFAYFIATAGIRSQRRLALILVGLAVVAVLHGFYDWFAGVQTTIAALIIGLSFMLFYGYVSKLRGVSVAAEPASSGASG
jgi:RsiW-degrading membrane proteinase PrsW (M82 family)